MQRSTTALLLALAWTMTGTSGAAQPQGIEPRTLDPGDKRIERPAPSPGEGDRPSTTRPAAPQAPLARAAPPSVLAILAHPDDEITIAPVLAHIARNGGKVTLIFATSGDAGPGSSGLEPGAQVAELREAEGRCAAFALGLEEPVFWQLGDGALATMARAPDSAARRALALTTQAIAAARPDVIMTWGPDGGYGHADHRMISALVTQAVADMGPPRPDLLYAAFPRSETTGNLALFESWATTHESLITDAIRYFPADLDAAKIALDCYQSQFPDDARTGLIDTLHTDVWQGMIHFRLAFPGTK